MPQGRCTPIFVELNPLERLKKSRELKWLEAAKYYKSQSFKKGHKVWKNWNFKKCFTIHLGNAARNVHTKFHWASSSSLVFKSGQPKRLEAAKYYKFQSFKNGHKFWKNSNFKKCFILVLGNAVRNAHTKFHWASSISLVFKSGQPKLWKRERKIERYTS